MKKYNVCIVGGGSTYTLGFLKSFARMQEEFPLNKLVLFDIDEKRQEPIGKFGDILFAEKNAWVRFLLYDRCKGSISGHGFHFHADESRRTGNESQR